MSNANANTPGTARMGSGYGRAEAGKYPVPSEEVEWDRFTKAAACYVREHRLTAPLAMDELRGHAAALAGENGLPERHHEFLMIQINNEVWRDVVAAIPFSRRTLLLPPCLRSSEGCPAEFDEFGLLCRRCGRCGIGALSDEAEQLGYAVLVAEGTAIVADLVRKGMIDAVIGVSCMPSLERTFPHLFTRAVPGIAIPLLKEGCEDTTASVERVRGYMTMNSGAAGLFLDLKKIHAEVQSWFQEPVLRAVLGAGDSETENISLAWLAKSGKRWRPFLTVSAYRALRPEDGPVPEPVRKVAIALECIHKASLIYDDIQDNDDQRYGDATVHREHGVPVALTAGLYLLGQGYRLIAGSGADTESSAAMIRLATWGHCELCLGQGGELCWMRKPVPLSTAQVLDIFRLKTAPSFEVVFRLGAICGGATPAEHSILKAYSEAMGIAYQILDDLQDFKSGGDVDDVRSGRPSIVVAAACEQAGEADRRILEAAWCGRQALNGAGAESVRELIVRNGGEEKAKAFLEAYKDKALRSLRPLGNRNLKLLLHRIVAMVFERG